MWKKSRIYLDIAAGVSGNPSSPHTEGRRSRELLEGARAKIARLVEVKADDLIFTSGATEANALAILGVYRKQRTEKNSRPHMLYLPSAHASVVENMKLVEAEGVVIESLPIGDCRVDCDILAGMLRPETVLISMDAVCGETGVVWNTREVRHTLDTYVQTWFAQRERPVLHVDASQAAMTEKLTRAHFGADLMTLDASKVCPARGIGCLIAPRSIPLAPLYVGGGQERGLRPGSEAPELARAFAEGLEGAGAEREVFRAEAGSARAELVAALESGTPDILINEGPKSHQASHILNISLPGRDTDYLLALLDEAGFAVSTKSACETDSGEGSRAVLALWNDPERAASTLRISWGREVRSHDLARFAHALATACAFIDSTGAK